MLAESRRLPEERDRAAAEHNRDAEGYSENGDGRRLLFEEGVDAYVPYAGKMSDNLDSTLAKLKSVMCNCGALTLGEFRPPRDGSASPSHSSVDSSPGLKRNLACSFLHGPLAAPLSQKPGSRLEIMLKGPAPKSTRS